VKRLAVFQNKPFAFGDNRMNHLCHYWDVEFAPGRGAIHLHIVAIAKDMAYLQGFYHMKTAEDKAAVVDKYAREHLDMTADVNINDDKQRKPEYQNSPLGKRYCESPDQEEDVRACRRLHVSPM
jgi:hypothetical protein